MRSQPGPPPTLGSTAAAAVRIIVWCKGRGHQTEPDPAATATRYGVDTLVSKWMERLVCSQCGGRDIDSVLTGSRR